MKVRIKIRRSGFTLIELLVVISIISSLASIILVSLNFAKAKVRDAEAMMELRQVSTALYLYYAKHNTMPTPVTIAPHTTAFNEIAQTLVSEGFLGAVPVAPANHTYQYYNYGPRNEAGGLLVTSLEAANPTYQPYAGTCRPWSGAVNWCDIDVLSTNWCLCNYYQ